MQAIVHFAIGVTGMLVVLTVVDLDQRTEFILPFASGLWALVPDLGWLLLRIERPGAADLWKSVFNSVLGYIFWFHPFLDGLEPVNRVVELTGGFTILAVGVVIYYFGNGWDE